MASEFRADPKRPIFQGSNAPQDATLCKAGVWTNGRAPRYNQCKRKPFKDGWCKQHHPDVEAERERAATERYESSVRRSAMGWFGEGFLSALAQIRDGHNDPRTVAAEALRGCNYAPPPPERLQGEG